MMAECRLCGAWYDAKTTHICNPMTSVHEPTECNCPQIQWGHALDCPRHPQPAAHRAGEACTNIGCLNGQLPPVGPFISNVSRPCPNPIHAQPPAAEESNKISVIGATLGAAGEVEVALTRLRDKGFREGLNAGKGQDERLAKMLGNALQAIEAAYKRRADYAVKPLPGLNKATFYARWYDRGSK